MGTVPVGETSHLALAAAATGFLVAVGARDSFADMASGRSPSQRERSSGPTAALRRLVSAVARMGGRLASDETGDLDLGPALAALGPVTELVEVRRDLTLC